MILSTHGILKSSAVNINTHSVNFDTGAGSKYITMGNVAAFNLAAGTISAWVKTAGKAGNLIMAKANFSTARNGYYFYTTGGNAINFGVSNATSANTEATVSFAAFLNTWTHVAATWGDGNLKIYINGALSATRAQTVANNSSTSNFNIGSDTVLSSFYSGKQTHNAVFSVALNLAEIGELISGGKPADLNSHSQFANLISWWYALDPTEFSTYTDRKGGHNGTMTNMVSGDIQTDVP